MTSRRIPTAVGLALALVVALGLPAFGGSGSENADVEVDRTDNVKHLKQFKRQGGTELAAQGKFLYSGQLDGGPEAPSRGTEPDRGGVYIYRVDGKKPRQVGFFHCPGNDNDVEVVRPGLIAMGHHTAACNPPMSGGSASGVILLDVRKPSKPKMVGRINLPSGGSAHTIKPMPGTDYIYVNPGGLPTNGGRVTYILDVSNPKKPEVAGQYTPPPPTQGCHDFAFHIDKDKKLGFCAGYAGTQIWDVSDPLAPTVLSTIVNPAIQFHHYATASSDGTLLAIDDEAFAFHECHTGQSPTGRVWVYDITNPSLPVLQAGFGPPRGGDGTFGHYLGWIPSWCLSHGLDWQPGTHNLAVTWFTGGWSVIDFSTPTSPEEVAYFMAEDSAAYSALWHRNRLYINDSARGVDAFSIKLKK